MENGYTRKEISSKLNIGNETLRYYEQIGIIPKPVRTKAGYRIYSEEDLLRLKFIKMAKDQNLSLNPAKISGLCGRLMCCLKYENDEYEQAKRELPDMGEFMKTPYGKGKVVGLNMLERLIQIELNENEQVIEYTLDELINEGMVAQRAK